MTVCFILFVILTILLCPSLYSFSNPCVTLRFLRLLAFPFPNDSLAHDEHTLKSFYSMRFVYDFIGLDRKPFAYEKFFLHWSLFPKVISFERISSSLSLLFPRSSPDIHTYVERFGVWRRTERARAFLLVFKRPLPTSVILSQSLSFLAPRSFDDSPFLFTRDFSLFLLYLRPRHFSHVAFDAKRHARSKLCQTH